MSLLIYHVNIEHHNDNHRAELPLKDGMGGPVLWGWVAQPGNPISKVVLVEKVIIFFNIMKYHEQGHDLEEVIDSFYYNCFGK